MKPDLRPRISEPPRPYSAVPKAHPRGARPSCDRTRRVRPGVAVAVTVLALGLGARAQDPCVGFLERSIDSDGLKGADSVFAIDLNGDGKTDVLSASHNDHRIAWYENPGGSGPELDFESHTIDTDALSASSVFAADLDGDGDPEVLSASRNDGTVAWYENDGNESARFRKRVVTAELATPLAVFAADVDGDGDQDILSASFTDNKIAWFENLRDEDAGIGVSFEEHVVTLGARGAASVFAADLDGDGDTDIVSASRLDGKIAWYEQGVEIVEDAPQIVFDEHVLTTAADGANSVFVADLDGENGLDIIAASTGDNTIRWFENPGGWGSEPEPEFEEHTLTTEAAGARSVFAADLNGNGVDVVAASANDDTVAWYENKGGTPLTFEKHIISADTVSADAVFAAPINTDDDFIDVLSISSATGETFTSDKLAWYKNDGTSPIPDFTEDVIADTASGADAIAVADIDGDGAPDLLAARSDNPLAWYKNDGTTAPSFTGQDVVAGSARNATSVLGADLDGEPGIDMVAGFPLDDTVAWYQNDGEASPGFTEHVITTDAVSVESVFAADLNGDGNLDLLSASSGDDKIAWYKNSGGSAPEFPEQIISEAAQGARSVFAVDLDGDDDIDVLSASPDDNKIAWYENDGDTQVPAFTEYAVTPEALGASFVTAADLDGDGDTDVIAILSRGTIAWFGNNGDGAGAELTFGTFVLGSIPGLSELLATDVDDDGDLDLAAIASGSTRVLWYENNGGNPPSFSGHLVQGSALDGRSLAAADLNGDADLDFAAGYQAEIVWYEQLDEICAGFDATSDGVIDGVELAWLARSFGSSSDDPGSQWWAGIDLNQDGSVDGDDLAILTSFGVWGRTPDTCTYSCQ